MELLVAALLIRYPEIDPVLVQIGPFAIRWYALAYIGGILIGWRYVLRLTHRPWSVVEERTADDFLIWATLGIVLGGRLGYVLFYKPDYYAAHPLEALFVWQGGMSFHGGLVGVVVALLLYCGHRRVNVLDLSDLVAPAVPIGLFFGRIANFINGELWGRPSDVPWAMVFPGAGPLPRHPSQLYEAALEGILLFVVLWLVGRSHVAPRRGFLTGTFLAGYATARMIAELFREPDAYLGFLYAGATMGQLLSLPMLAIGLWLMVRARPPA